MELDVEESPLAGVQYPVATHFTGRRGQAAHYFGIGPPKDACARGL